MEGMRHIRVRGMRNLRDLGGYLTVDGKRVKWAVLYRSDALVPSGRAALAAIDGLGLATVVDFRTEEERRKHPDRLPAERTVRQVFLPVFDGPGSLEEVLRGHLAAGTLGGVDPGALFRQAYEQLPMQFLPQFRSFIREVLKAEGKPLLFHCVAGKDRTGFAAALLLRLLGVPMATILEDYLLSRRYVVRVPLAARAFFRVRHGAAAYTIVKRMMTIEAEYMEAAFASIDRVYGSFDAFVRDGLGMDAAEVAVLRANFLADAAGIPGAAETAPA